MRDTRAVVTFVLLTLGGALAAGQEQQPRFDIRVEARRLSFEELSQLVPALARVTLPPGFRISKLEAVGPMDRLSIDFAAESQEGAIQAHAIVDASDPGRSARGTASLRRVNLAAMLERETLPSDATADVDYDITFDGEDEGMRGTFAVASPGLALAGYRATAIRVKGRIDGSALRIDGRLNAYGASLNANGEITLGDVLRYDIRGGVRDVDLRRLPASLNVPELASDVDLTYQVAGTTEEMSGRVELGESRLAGATLAAGSAATFERRSGEIRYRAEGRLAGFNLREVGRGLQSAALASPRFESDLAARFAIEGRGARIAPVDLTIENSTILGGRVPALKVRAALSEGAIEFSAGGRFEELNVGTMAGRENVHGAVTGMLDIEGAIPRSKDGLQSDRMNVRGRIAMEPSSVEGIAITEGVIAGSLENGALVRVEQLEILGESLAIRASGDVGLDSSVETSLEYFVDTPPLGALSDLIGADVEGDLTLEGRATGAAVLQLAGTLTGTSVAFRDNGAAELSSRYDISVPRDDLPMADIQAEATASGLELGGQNFENLKARATYRDGRGEFDAALSRADESVALGGRFDWQEHEKAVELTSLGLRAAGADWQLASGAKPAIVYGGEGVGIEDLRIVSATQAISADGRIGREGDSLRLKLENVALEPFARMAGRQTIRGTLSADATVGGEMSDPTIEGTFALRDAAFQQVEITALTGRVDFDREQLTFDARVERPDASWLRAAGAIPSAMLRRGDAAEPTGSLDVTVESSPIGLDVVQLFTDQLLEVQGTMQADLRVTGTLDDPKPTGEIRIAGGAFRVPRLGTQYQQLEGSVSLEPAAVVVQQLRLVDDDGDHLELKGRLPVERLRVTGVELEIVSTGLEVMDNAYGDVDVVTDLDVVGDLTEPRITGRIEVAEGTINVDEILALGGRDAYATRAAEQGLLTGEEGRTAAASEGMLADVPLALDVTVNVPTLLLRGQDIRGAGGGGVGLGNVNLTAQGELTLRKPADDSLRIDGDIGLVRGTYEFQGREFELVRGGTVRFTGLPEPNPLLDVTARREISAVEAIVGVGGTLKEPTLELRSNPPLDEADILSLIVFNRPVNSLGAGEQVSLSNRASALASGFVAGQLTEALGSAFDVDMFEIEARQSDGLGPAVTLGEQFGDLFVSVQQQFGSESQSRVAVEYEVNEWLRFESSYVERSSATPLLRRREDSGVDAVVTFEY